MCRAVCVCVVYYQLRDAFAFSPQRVSTSRQAALFMDTLVFCGSHIRLYRAILMRWAQYVESVGQNTMTLASVSTTLDVLLEGETPV